MRACGVELKNNEAIICLLAKTDGLYDIPDCRVARLTLEQVTSRDQLLHFQKTFSKLMEDYKIANVAIRERPIKGKFAGGAIGFKLESAIQLISNLNVNIISPTEIKHALSEHPLRVKFSDTGLKAFQEAAFLTAYGFLASQEHGSNYYGN